MNKVTLKYELDLNFTLIAITCHLKDYRLCFYINKLTGSNFIKNDDHELWRSTNHSSFFTKYSYINHFEETESYLIGNKGINGGFLIPEMKGTDYFMIILSHIDEEDLSDLLNALNRIEQIVVASKIDPEKLKSKENLVF